jgi:hypothetical protein
MNKLWIIGTIILSPIFAIYGLWIYGGHLMDRAGQRWRLLWVGVMFGNKLRQYQ